VQAPSVSALAGRRVLAFAGIASPGKFFDPLRAAGAELVAARPFPDHHPFTRRELELLLRQASGQGAIPVTTPKDAVRLPADIRPAVTVVGVGLTWRDPAEIDQLLLSAMDGG
jgi:tetraacyldisaccharide 4'-kinase